MALRKWTKIRQVLEIRNPWWTYRRDDVLLPNGRHGEYHFVHVEGSSMIIPRLNDGRILLVNQYRYLRDKDSLEFPCGSVKPGSTHDATAVNELAEETGFRAGDIRCIGEFNPYNGVTDEICRVYLASRLLPVTAAHDDTEEFEQVPLTAEEIETKVQSGEIWDGMTLAAWSFARSLFGV